jgi:hypothetical protein
MTMPSAGRGEPWRDEHHLEARRAGASRDAGLRRVSRLTGWTVAIAIGLTGILSEVAAQALPGHSKQRATTTPRPARGAKAPAASAPAAGAGDQTSAAPDPQPSAQQPSVPQPPEQAPAPSAADSGAVSGGS